MEKFIEEISSIYWWVAVVLVGIGINIASAYIRKALELRLSAISSYWAKNRKLKEEALAKKIELLVKDRDLKTIYALSEIRYRIRSVAFVIFSFMFFALGVLLTSTPLNIACLIFGSVSMIIGMDDHRAAMNVKSLVNKATNGLTEVEK